MKFVKRVRSAAVVVFLAGGSLGSVSAFSSAMSMTSSRVAVPCCAVPATLDTKWAILCSVLASVVTESSLS